MTDISELDERLLQHLHNVEIGIPINGQQTQRITLNLDSRICRLKQIDVDALSGTEVKRHYKRSIKLIDDLLAEYNFDRVTGLFNRNYFMEKLQKSVMRASKGDDLSMILLDLDGLKTINDRYGHNIGDEVLQMYGGVIKSNLRPYDLPFRIGGDEAAILLPGADEKVAVQVAQRIKESIKKQPVHIPIGKSFTVHVSAGVKQFDIEEDMDTGESKYIGQEFYKNTDGRLYIAKAYKDFVYPSSG